MTVLVDDLLLLARLDAGRPLEREPVDLSRLVIETTSDARVARGDHRWRLDLPDEPVMVPGDEHRLHQVMANLLSNAGKHTPAGSTVSVALALGATVTGTARHRGHRGGAARRRALGAASGAEHHRRRPRHPARTAARTVRAVHPRRHRPRPGGQRRREEHGPRPGHRGRRCRRARRLHHRDQPAGHDPVRHPPPAAARARPRRHRPDPTGSAPDAEFCSGHTVPHFTHRVVPAAPNASGPRPGPPMGGGLC